MRYRVDFKWGYISFSEEDKLKAIECYETRDDALRLVEQNDIFDEGTLLCGVPIIVDYSNDEYTN